MSSKIPALFATLATVAAMASTSAIAQESEADAAAAAAALEASRNAGLLQVIGQPLYIAPMVTAVFTDGNRQTEDGMGVALTVGRRLTDFLTLEGSAYISRHKPAHNMEVAGSDQHLNGYGVAALISPFHGALANVYGIVGAHYVDSSSAPVRPEGSPTTTFTDYKGYSGDVGLGLLSGITLFSTPSALRLEARYRYEKSDEDLGAGKDTFGDIVVGLGIMIPLFWSPPQAAAPAAEQPPVEVSPTVDNSTDSDGDGMVDSMDKCPDTPPNSTVDMDGCPAAAPQG